MLQIITNVKNIQDKTYFVYFGADWCKACLTPKSILQNISKYVIYEFDTTKDCSEFEVVSIPCLIAFRKGNPFARKNISESSEDNILSWIELMKKKPDDNEKEKLLKKWSENQHRVYGEEFTHEEIKQMKEDGIVVVYGASDDLVEIDGAIKEEIDSYIDSKFGYIKNKFVRGKDSNFILDVRHDINNCTFWFSTNVMQSTFVVYDEYDEPYCRGVFVSIYDIVDNS